MNRTHHLLAVAVIAAVTFSAGAASAEDVWVNSSAKVTIRAGKGPVYDGVADVRKGDKLTVIERDGPWLKVNAGGKVGWVHEKLISAQEVKADFKPFAGNANTATVTEGAASRLNPDAVKYATGKNLNPEWMKWLESFRDGLRGHPQEWEDFMRQGEVGNYAPKR